MSGCVGSRHIVANSQGDLVAVWWTDSGEFGEDMNNVVFFTKNRCVCVCSRVLHTRV